MTDQPYDEHPWRIKVTFSSRSYLLILSLFVTMFGCPRPFQPAAAPTLTSPDTQANQRFNRARLLFDEGDLPRAESAFREFISNYPLDPLKPLALVYQGRIALKQGTLDDAYDYLQGPAARPEKDEVGMQARYYLGLTLIRKGEYATGKKNLEPFLKLVEGDERPAVLASLGYANLRLMEKDDAARREYADNAVRYLEELYRVTQRPVEKLFAFSHLEALVNRINSRETLHSMIQMSGVESLTAALASQKLAVLESEAGQLDEAQRILAETATARARYGIKAIETSSSVKQVIGVLVPFYDRYQAVGKKMLAGITEASSTFTKKGQATVVIRDCSRAPEAAARALITQEGAAALVGTISSHGANAIAKVAAQYGVPFISLAKGSTQQSSGVSFFSLLPDNAGRAQALARLATRKLKLRRYAILAPKTPFGTMMADAFADAVQSRGGRVVSRIVYPQHTSSFTSMAEDLARSSFEGLFIPDTGRTLALIAPAFAKAKLWSGSTPSVHTKGKEQTIQILSTADGLSEDLVHSAGRYVKGAILAPGFFPDAHAPRSGPLVQRFSSSQGYAPSLVEALAFDGVHMVNTLLSMGIQSKSALMNALNTGKSVTGMTGEIRFQNNGTRADSPLLYRISGNQIKQLP